MTVKKEFRLLINRNDTVIRKTEFSLIYHLNFFLDLFVLEKGVCMIVVHWYTYFFNANGECHQHSYTTGAYMYIVYVCQSHFIWMMVSIDCFHHIHVRMHSWVMILIKRYKCFHPFACFISCQILSHLRQNPDIYICNK